MIGPLRIALLAAVLAGPWPANAADLWGLAVGIDDYQHVRKLQGAVSDANDIKTALTRLGAKQVVLLANEQATKPNIIAEWKALTAAARPGDTMVVSFAGHGGAQAGPGGSAVRFVALPNFQIKDTTSDEVFRDSDFGDLLRSAPQLKIIFVVDACHSGTMTRSYGQSDLSVRSIGTIDSPTLRAASRSLAEEEEGLTLPFVTHLGAVRTDEVVPEIQIDGHKRGAMSYAFARSLEGAADTDKDGEISGPELTAYITTVVSQKSEGMQHPVISVPQSWSLNFTAPSVAAQLISLRTVPIAIVDTGGRDPAAIVKGLQDSELADKSQATLIWDVERGQIRNGFGDLVANVSAPAQGADPIAPPLLQEVQRVFDKIATVEALKADTTAHPLQISLAPDDKVHRAGTQLSFNIAQSPYRYLTLFDLASDGTVNFLYPLNTQEHRDPPEIAHDQPYSLPLTATPPFGADHLVAIMSADPLPALHSLLAEIDGKPSARLLGTRLSDILAGKTYQIGLYPSFTEAAADPAK